MRADSDPDLGHVRSAEQTAQDATTKKVVGRVQYQGIRSKGLSRVFRLLDCIAHYVNLVRQTLIFDWVRLIPSGSLWQSLL